MADLTKIASTSTIAFKSSSLFEPSQFLISKSGPRAFTVAGESSSAIRTIGLDIFQVYLVDLLSRHESEQYLT